MISMCSRSRNDLHLVTEQQTGNAIPLAYRRLRYEDVVDGFLGALPSLTPTGPIMATRGATFLAFRAPC